MSSDVIWHIRDKLWPMPKHGSIRKVYACLAVTCHLHFWQNDRDFLRATVVTRGWNGYRNKSQHRKSTLEKKILPPFQQGFEPATFQSRVRCSNHWAIPAPCVLLPCKIWIRCLSSPWRERGWIEFSVKWTSCWGYTVTLPPRPAVCHFSRTRPIIQPDGLQWDTVTIIIQHNGLQWDTVTIIIQHNGLQWDTVTIIIQHNGLQWGTVTIIIQGPSVGHSNHNNTRANSGTQ